MLKEEQVARLETLSRMCAATHTPEDVWTHLEEEMIELLLAIKRVQRRRAFFPEVLEELIDSMIEINTVLTQLNMPDAVRAMVDAKLNKFEAMLLEEDHRPKPINRYRPIPTVYGDSTQF